MTVAAVATSLLSACATLPRGSGGADLPLTFAVIGDMPYTLPADYQRLDRVIASINAVAPAFTIHVGDVKSGSSSCSDEVLLAARTRLEQLSHPLVYTPGDNEWTDCHRPAAGAFDPLERLVRLRELYFGTPRAVADRQALAAISQDQSDNRRFARFVENVRFDKSGAVVATVHVTGSNNNLDTARPGAVEEHRDRSAAGSAWIDATFAHARVVNARAVVIAWHADVLLASPNAVTGMRESVAALARGAAEFGRPVLVVYGDSHRLELQRMRDLDGRVMSNVLALQIMGAAEQHAVIVRITPGTPARFAITPHFIEENVP